jgi:hypothetical protein
MRLLLDEYRSRSSGTPRRLDSAPYDSQFVGIQTWLRTYLREDSIRRMPQRQLRCVGFLSEAAFHPSAVKKVRPIIPRGGTPRRNVGKTIK